LLKSNISLGSKINIYEFYLLLYIILINCITFIVYGIDKNKAKNKKNRISENTLILLCIFGGSIGGIMSMVSFHHKLSKKKFYIGLPILIILNMVIELIVLNYIRT
jgi:uncharacterized membrane protein YsdA (DUF1294 family)